MSEATNKDWNKANQRYLATLLETVREELELYQSGLKKKKKRWEFPFRRSTAVMKELESAEKELSKPSALDKLTDILGLSTFERKILLLCAGVELDAEFCSLITDLQGNSSIPYPSFSLALAAFSDAHWSATAPVSPLRYWNLVRLNDEALITKSPLKIDENILHYLTGVYYMDDRLREILYPAMVDNYQLVPSHEELANNILQTLSTGNQGANLPVIQLEGDERLDQMAIAASACARWGLNLYVLPIYSIPNNLTEVTKLVRLWNRESALNAYALFLDCAALDETDKARVQLAISFIKDIQGVLILGHGQWSSKLKRSKVTFSVNKPTKTEQLLLWNNHLGEAAENINGSLKEVAAHFNLSAGAIAAASLDVMRRQTKNTKAAEASSFDLEEAIWKACFFHTRPKIDELAQRIEAVADWDALVLPAMQKQILREIAIQVKNRSKVYNEWGFSAVSSRGLGISALFTGESGTGKTMASEVLANELQLDLYRIDLSQVVNKYIGETEKNLKRIFDAAEEGGVILLFDEADALFGKRSDVKDSHDRYSNIEVSYLLQRMESYSGLAIMTTNMKKAIDKAFFRRIRFVIRFPFPDARHRTEIWKRVFPTKTPVSDLDIEKLSRLSIAGGNIKNIAMNAAFLAANENAPVQMSHILQAARSEYNKLEKTLSINEIKGWV